MKGGAMYFEPERDGMRPAPFTHSVATSLVVPRPIGWISTMDADGVVNLAPFSYFNLVSTDPLLVVFAPNGWKSGVEGVVKDSLANARATGEFVFNLCTEELTDQMNQTSAHVPASVNEMAEAGLEAADCVRVKPPRVAASPIALECEVLQTLDLPAAPNGAPNHLVIGQVVGVHVDDEVIVDGVIDIGRLRPLARLGGLEYAAVSGDAVFALRRPD